MTTIILIGVAVAILFFGMKPKVADAANAPVPGASKKIASPCPGPAISAKPTCDIRFAGDFSSGGAAQCGDHICARGEINMIGDAGPPRMVVLAPSIRAANNTDPLSFQKSFGRGTVSLAENETAIYLPRSGAPRYGAGGCTDYVDPSSYQNSKPVPFLQKRTNLQLGSPSAPRSNLIFAKWNFGVGDAPPQMSPPDYIPVQSPVYSGTVSTGPSIQTVPGRIGRFFGFVDRPAPNLKQMPV